MTTDKTNTMSWEHPSDMGGGLATTGFGGNTDANEGYKGAGADEGGYACFSCGEAGWVYFLLLFLLPCPDTSSVPNSTFVSVLHLVKNGR